MSAVVHSTECCAERVMVEIVWCAQEGHYRVVHWYDVPGQLFDDDRYPVYEASTTDITFITTLLHSVMVQHRRRLQRSRSWAHGRRLRRPSSGGPATP